jgi:flagellar basal-body rod modification protein FlgD
MSQIPSVGAGGGKPSGTVSALNEVDVDDFLSLMIAELQNQDPLNPLDNDELMAQMSQIRSVGATEKLTQTLDSVLLGQNIASATNLIGAQIDAISDDGQRVSGIVERVSVAAGQPKLHLDLNPRAEASEEEGSVEAGEYEYRVVWRDGGNLFAVDPLAGVEGKKLKITGEAQSVLLSNLPETTTEKQVFRRKAGENDFRLVGAVSDGKKSTFLDTTATDDLSELVLSGTPEMIKSERTFTVSLKNVGEISPPPRLAP